MHRPTSRYLEMYVTGAYLEGFYFNPYPGKWGVKWPPVHFCLCISKTVRYTAMRFWDIVQDSEGFLSPYKVVSHLYQKCGHDGMKPEVRFRKWRKVVCPIVNLMITSNKHFHRLLSCFHGHLAWICCWHGFLMSIFIAICDPGNMCHVFGIYRYLAPVWL